MPGKDKNLHWQDKRLDAKEQGVHKPHGIDQVIKQPLGSAETLVIQLVMIAGISIRNALAAGRYIVGLTGVERLHENCNRPGAGSVLQVE